MATEGCAFNEMRQTLQRKLSLNDDRRIGLLNKLHISIRLRPINARTGKITLAREN